MSSGHARGEAGFQPFSSVNSSKLTWPSLKAIEYLIIWFKMSMEISFHFCLALWLSFKEITFSTKIN